MLINDMSSVLETLIDTPAVELTEYWNEKTNEKKKIMD